MIHQNGLILSLRNTSHEQCGHFGGGADNGAVVESAKFVVESPFSWRDVRYTTKGEYLYAFILGWPPKNKRQVELSFVSPGNTRIGEVQSVKMLGHDGDLDWQQHPDGLRVTFPEVKPCDFAYGLKIHVAKNAE